MARRWLRQLCPALALLATLALVSLAQAKGPPDKLTISGPGLQGEVEVTDPALLANVGLGSLEQLDSSGSSIPAPTVGEGYTLVRYLRNPNGTYQPWDQAHYYPNAVDGRGVVFYDGMLGSNSSELDGKWFYTRPEGDAGMQQLLKAIGAVPPESQALPSAGGIATARSWLIGLGGVLLLTGLLLTGALVRRWHTPITQG